MTAPFDMANTESTGTNGSESFDTAALTPPHRYAHQRAGSGTAALTRHDSGRRIARGARIAELAIVEKLGFSRTPIRAAHVVLGEARACLQEIDALLGQRNLREAMLNQASPLPGVRLIRKRS